MERVIAQRIYDHLIDCNLLSSAQHDFVKRRCTCTILLKSVNDRKMSVYYDYYYYYYQWRIQLWAVASPPPIDQNLGLAMAARHRHGGKFSLKSSTFGHFLV